MTDTITLTGLVATVPRHLTTGEGLPITSFRLASSQSRYDRASNSWIDAGTNWFTVSTFRRLALGVATSIRKGDRVVVTGRLRIREWTSTEKSGTTIEVDAEALGHDLNWGSALFTRTMSAAAAAGGEPVDSGTLDSGQVDPALADPALADPELADPALADPALADPARPDADESDPELSADEFPAASELEESVATPF